MIALKKLVFLGCWLLSFAALGGEVIPPMPQRDFNDYAHVVPQATVAQLNAKLADFERATGNQIVVAVYPKMQSDSSIDDYTVRVARSWKAGQQLKNNGAVLFVFIQDRQMFLQVGYGLEGVLPDALCKQITEFEIKPHFKTGDYAGGLTAGVNAILAATRHEYKGTGTTVFASHANRAQNWTPVIVIALFMGVMLLQLLFRGVSRRHGWLYSGGGWGGYSGGGFISGGGFSSGSSGGGGFSGGFMGGGGSFGGGGAGSSW
jgi:uncharacterized protein